MDSERKIGHIQNGVVIDHIPQGDVWKVAKILRVDEHREGRVSLGDGYESGKSKGLKGVLKIEGRNLSEFELNLVALIAPNATISVVREGVVYPEDKRKAKIPSELKGVVFCPNSDCVTNVSKEKISPMVHYDESSSLFKCHYCEEIFSREKLILS
jgi:aspartate carbamoyltransferase regulatory subunit